MRRFENWCFFVKKSCERLSPPTTNAFLVESTILFALLLQLVALHCKLGEIFLLKILKHEKSRKSSLTFGIYSSIFVGFYVAICGR